LQNRENELLYNMSQRMQSRATTNSVCILSVTVSNSHLASSQLLANVKMSCSARQRRLGIIHHQLISIQRHLKALLCQWHFCEHGRNVDLLATLTQKWHQFDPPRSKWTNLWATHDALYARMTPLDRARFHESNCILISVGLHCNEVSNATTLVWWQGTWPEGHRRSTCKHQPVDGDDGYCRQQIACDLSHILYSQQQRRKIL